VAAQTGGVIGPHYAASKAGLIGLTHSYASQLAKQGISVNAIAPALIETEMVTTNPHASTERLPVGFFGAPQEIGRVAVTLAESDFITGQTISVNGGWYMTSFLRQGKRRRVATEENLKMDAARFEIIAIRTNRRGAGVRYEREPGMPA
jgi:NAD(P)-dependent dehydrogenase (short-subunit alcohol dehydrogenase family)